MVSGWGSDAAHAVALPGGHRVHGFGGQGVEVDGGQGQAAAVQIKLLVHAAIDDVALSPEGFVDGDGPRPAGRVGAAHLGPFAIGMEGTEHAGGTRDRMRHAVAEPGQAVLPRPAHVQERVDRLGPGHALESSLGTCGSPGFVQRDAEILIDEDIARDTLPWPQAQQVPADGPLDHFNLILGGTLSTDPPGPELARRSSAMVWGGEGGDRGEALAGRVAALLEVIAQPAGGANPDRRLAQGEQPGQVAVYGGG